MIITYLPTRIQDAKDERLKYHNVGHMWLSSHGTIKIQHSDTEKKDTVETILRLPKMQKLPPNVQTIITCLQQITSLFETIAVLPVLSEIDHP